jgi:16S rRNA (guanine966-N2)-methyltransferase
MDIASGDFISMACFWHLRAARTSHYRTLMRIVGGKFRGHAIQGPSSTATRPTSDRVRESIFNILAHGAASFDIEGARVIDLFAGTGALGLEALSRGARFCQFVDESAEARGLIRRNADALGAVGLAKIWRRDATNLGPCAPQSPFDLAFVDPPYNRGLGEKALASLVAGGWLSPGAVVVLEEAEKAEVGDAPGLALLDRRNYGDTQVRFYRFGPGTFGTPSSS